MESLQIALLVVALATDSLSQFLASMSYVSAKEEGALSIQPHLTFQDGPRGNRMDT